MILFEIGQRNSNGTSMSNCCSAGDTVMFWDATLGVLGGADGSGDVRTVMGTFSGRAPGKDQQR